MQKGYYEPEEYAWRFGELEGKNAAQSALPSTEMLRNHECLQATILPTYAYAAGSAWSSIQLPMACLNSTIVVLPAINPTRSFVANDGAFLYCR